MLLYCKGANPPLPVAVIIPLVLLHDAAVDTAVTVGAGELEWLPLPLQYSY